MLTFKEQLKSIYKYRIELHAHTMPLSPCSEVSAKELAEIYHKEGFDGIVLTNHFIHYLIGEDSKSEFIDKYFSELDALMAEAKKYGIKVYMGIEIRFAENKNDYLIFGVNRDILEEAFDYLDKTLVDYRKNVKLKDSLFIQAHPLRNGMEEVDPSLLDGYEAFNMHPNHNSRVALVIKKAKETGKKIIVSGSDFHHPNRKHEGVAALRVKEMPKDSFALARVLRSGDYIFELGGESIVLP